MIKIYDTMTRSLREFQPIEEKTVRMYVCGPTVYNYIHIGNARSTVAFDTIRRYFEYRGYQVNYISNFTDVDDKIIKAGIELEMTPKEVADTFIAAFKEDTGKLFVKPATNHPRVMDYIPNIINFITVLLEKGYAYEASGDVYYRVTKFKDYGKLANKTLADLEAGASGRVDDERALKENPLDFALWKSAKEGEISWDSPWGAGRPGWHIECSVMSTELLGDTIDIHAGGADLEFPHHTNEIAQSEAKTGQTFANYWMHNGFVNVDNEKMSKSLGNFVTVHDMLKTVDGQVLRFFLATQHYRKPINFTEKAIHDADVNLKYLKNAYSQSFKETVDEKRLNDFVSQFTTAMDDDFNAANGITVIFELAKWINSGNYNQAVKTVFSDLLAVFGIFFDDEEDILDEAIEKLIEERQQARENRDFATADRIRDDLAKKGIKLLDTKDGVRWTRA
ncbi:cysteine--tRNA ligase [Streptococcus zalophi]|uniref:Cysteine--tRNA ligase n=1 Tax=Streptococcus zalophi TaxID=640031 RepID=A0A934UDX1_9STRE|nr:cysteine--tRNA ligase [Streptococcus zalophi]MBJ8350252.1 cysteine--tRNA ligase [Streptococcus zalophi]